MRQRQEESVAGSQGESRYAATLPRRPKGPGSEVRHENRGMLAKQGAA